MFKIFSASQIRQLDQFTIDHESIASIQLMERACKAFVDWFVAHVLPENKVGVVCGTGNNGGDGLGIARLLHTWNYPVEVWIIRGGKESTDFKINLRQLPEKVPVHDWSNDSSFSSCSVLIDAIFGTGLTLPVEGHYREAIDQINQSSARIISVDVPSGLQTDAHSEGSIVRAHHTITFQLPKLSFLLPENEQYVGEWTTVDIGLNKTFQSETESDYFFLNKKGVRKLLRPRQKFDHKGTFGHALLVAGSLGKMGAAVLSARAALRAGAGLVSVHAPKCGYTILQTAIPEAMVSVDSQEEFITEIPNEIIKTVGIGPGLGTNPKTVLAVEAFLKSIHTPMVIDADALNILSQQKSLLDHIPTMSILTPHPKELERLMGDWTNDFEKLDMLKEFASCIKSIIVLKGAYTAIVTPERKIFFNSTGNPGMATGGSGDVLTGILTGLLAQRYEPLEAAILGVYLHGLAGDLAVREKNIHSLIASDLAEFLPAAFRSLSR